MFTKKTTIEQHKDPKMLPPRLDARKHYDKEVENELKAEKEAAVVTPITNEELIKQLDIPGRYLEVDFSRQDATLYWMEGMKSLPVSYEDVIKLFNERRLKGVGHNQYIKVSRRFRYASRLLISDSAPTL